MSRSILSTETNQRNIFVKYVVSPVIAGILSSIAMTKNLPATRVVRASTHQRTAELIPNPIVLIIHSNVEPAIENSSKKDISSDIWTCISV